MSKPKDIPQDVWDAVLDLPIQGEGFCDYADLEVIARAILSAKAEEAERHRLAHQIISNKAKEANSQRGEALQKLHEAERRERLLTMNRDDWKERALSAEAHLHSLGHVNTAHKNSVEA